MEIISQLKRPLKIEDVDFRIQSINKGGYATILAYKNARVDMNRLDEVCNGVWQKEFKYIPEKGLLFCKVGIKINDEWIWKEDIGAESFADKEKGHASDAFKRACFNWGIGRELYDYPKIQVKLNPDEFSVSERTVKQTYNLQLDKWVWTADIEENGTVNNLSAIDQNGRTRFTYSKNSPQENTNPAPAPAPAPTQNTKPLPFLEKMNGKEMSNRWLEIVQRIVNKNTPAEKKITSIDLVKNHFQLTPDNEKELINLIKSVNNGSN